MSCPSCGAEGPRAFLCATCGRVQPVRDAQDYLGLLGFEGPSVDPAELDRRYYELSRRLHPDRFAGGSPEDLQASVRAAAVLNSAHRTLRDPEARGRWWLRRVGGDLSSQDGALPPALAAYVFEVQEKIDDARNGLAGARAELGGVAGDLAHRLARGLEELEGNLREWTGRDVSGDTEQSMAARTRRKTRLNEILAELSYLRTLERDVQRTLEARSTG